MTFNGISEANVEEMSNAELFQYLFKAELDTETLFQDPALAVSPSSSTLATSPHSQYSSPAFDQSPATSSLSYSSPAAPPPYQHIDAENPQDLLLPEEPTDHIQPLMQLQAQPATTYPTLLPSTSFSYRQISPHMPPSMPAQMALPLTADTEATNEAHTQFLSLTETVTAAAASSSSLPPQQMNYWMQRFQQLQQLQQLHHQQQQQLLTSTFGTGMTSNLNSSSERSLSPSSPVSSGSSGSPTVKTERDVIYPSPPMKDDISMDSDSDCGPSHHDAQNGPDPLKPSPSELKKMTSKERRQLRNKLSARNFRVRRKEYIGTLETQVKEARREAADLQKKLAQSELNCQFLRQELETARLSQTLFNDGRLSREHANLLASLLNPNTEAFPTSSSSSLPAGGSTLSATPQQQQKDLMDSINHNNMTILNNSLAGVQTQSSAASSTTVDSQGAIQPFVPFDGNWELIVNRVEMVVDPSLDPKDVQSKQAVYHDLLTRYEAARQEAEVDEQMRTELKAYHDQKLAQTYIVMPKDDAVLTSSKASQDTLLLQTMVYMMMIHLTQSLFEAATLSKTQLVNVYQTMDEPLRSKMGQEQQERHHCKFAEWREAWIRKCWPSFYNNRQRVCELIKNGLCPSATSSSVVDVDETVRQMEEGVKGRTVETQPSPLCLWIRSYLPSWLKCPERAAQEEREALLRESSEKTCELAA